MSKERWDLNYRFAKDLDEIFTELEKDKNPIPDSIKNVMQTFTLRFIIEGPKIFNSFVNEASQYGLKGALIGGILGIGFAWYKNGEPALLALGFTIGALTGSYLSMAYPDIEETVRDKFNILKEILRS